MFRSATQCCGSIVLIIALCLACAPAPTQALNHTQIEVLKLFYNTTNGASWVNNSGWTTPQHLWGDPCNDTGEPFPTLFGVTCGAGQIQVFMMQTNNLDGTIPPTFFIEHDQLVTLLLNGNPKLTGQLPDFAYEAPLGTVLLSGCALTGTIPPSLFTFALTELEIDNNQLTGGMPDSVGNSTLMTLFTFGQNKLNIGPFPGSIVNCTQITSFSGIGSGITQLPDDFYLLNQTITLNLQDNRLEGTFPESWCKITSLVSLFLQDNPNLKGTLPECIGNWTQLVNLVIENTAMSGTIPNATFTANFSSTLTQLVLSGLTGGIPDLFNIFSSLQFVVLNGDNSKRNPPYSGPFPNTLIQLSSLISLSIQYTNIESPQTDFSLLTSLQILTLSSNPKMSMTLPSEILTSIWNVPSPTGPGSFAPGTVQRSLLIANMPLNGSLPHITNTVYNMSTFGGFAFDETDLVGYIPNSTFNWIPNSTHFSRKGLFAHCKYLLYPVRDWMLELTDNYAGYQFTITGIEGQSTFSYAGGELLTITGSNFLYLPDNIYCGFCVSGNISVCEQTEWASQHEMNESLAFSPGNQTYENKIICETPIVDNNIPVQVYIFYVGLAYSDTEEEFYRISSSSAVVNFYNPRPFLASLTPSFGRLEGCTTVIAIGSGFLNAPNMSLLISDVNNSIYVTGGVVINDTAAQFVVPHANSSAINAEYPFDLDFAIPVDMYVNGFEFPDQNATSNATYNFTKTCDSLLTPCADGFIDPEGCPDPLCMCFSQGNCMWTNATSNVSVHNNTYSFQCVCAEGFEGALCQSCTPGFYGASCAPCECVHGTCLDGMDRDGECVCEGPWFGKTCDTSWVGVGVGVVLGAVGSFALVFYIRRRRRRADYEQSAIAMNATTPTGVKEVYGSA